MRLYLSKDDDDDLRRAIDGLRPMRARVLFSYFYHQKTDIDDMMARFGDPKPDVFADSGAYSAFQKHTVIDPHAYAEWLLRWQDHFQVYANLDVIKNAPETWKNQQILEDAGLHPLPIYHALEPWDYFERYVDQYSYVGLGGIASAPWRVTFPWAVKCFRLAAGRCVFHGFGATALEILKVLPWYSVDSTSWSTGSRYGRVLVFDDRIGRFEGIWLHKAQSCYEHAALLRSYGVDPADMAEPLEVACYGSPIWDRMVALEAQSWARLEHWLRERHGPVCIPDNNGRDEGSRVHHHEAVQV